MKPILIVYATREGQTHRIAERVASTLRARGADSRVMELTTTPQPLELTQFAAVILAASVHMQRHEHEMVEFVKAQRAALSRMPTVFLSTSLSEAAAENANLPAEQRDRAHADVERMMEAFFAQTGFRPTTHKPVAGALLYTKYNWLVRLVMRQISKAEGGSTDTSRDHEYTDWVDLDEFVGSLVRSQFFVASNASPAANG